MKSSSLIICAVAMFALAAPASAGMTSFTVTGWTHQYPASTTPPAGAPWGTYGYPGDTVTMDTYTGTLNLTPGTYNLKINTLRWNIDYTYNGTETQWDYPAHWPELSFNIDAPRGMSIGTASGSLSQAGLLRTNWFNDYLSFSTGSLTSFIVVDDDDYYRVDVTPLGLAEVEGSNFSGDNPWTQPERNVMARFDVTSIPAPVPAPGAALLGVIGLGLVGWLKRRLA